MTQQDFITVTREDNTLYVEEQTFTIIKETYSCFFLKRMDQHQMLVRRDMLMTPKSNCHLTMEERAFLNVKNRPCFDPIISFNKNNIQYVDN